MAFCGARRQKQQREYRRFVEESLGEDEENQESFRTSELAIGDAPFVDWIRSQLLEKGGDAKCAADTALRHEEIALPVDDVLGVTGAVLGVERVAFRERRRGSDLRGIASRMLCRYAGLTQREAAEVLGMKTGAAVGQQQQRLETRLQVDSKLRRQVKGLEMILQEKIRC